MIDVVISLVCLMFIVLAGRECFVGRNLKMPVDLKAEDKFQAEIYDAAVKLLLSSEQNDLYYSPEKLTTKQRTENDIRWRNRRQRLLRLLRDSGNLPQRPPSHLAEYDIKWKKHRAHFTE